MKFIASIILLLMSSSTYCCSMLSVPEINPTLVGTVTKIETISGFSQRYSEATILIKESIEPHYLVGNEYKFIAQGPNGRGGCQAIVTVNETYEIEFNYISPENRQEKFKQWEGALGIVSVKPVNQALKAQPSAAGDAASGAP